MNSNQIELPLFRDEAPVIPELSAITCDDREDVPELSGPIMPRAGCMLLPPVDLPRLAHAYSAANWGWSMTAEQWREKLAAMPRMDQTAEVVCYYHSSVVPSPERLAAALIDHIQTVSRSSKVSDYSQGGGLLVFRSKSGRLGLIVECPLGEHYAKLKVTTP
jgi:hypothetical protein